MAFKMNGMGFGEGTGSAMPKIKWLEKARSVVGRIG